MAQILKFPDDSDRINRRQRPSSEIQAAEKLTITAIRKGVWDIESGDAVPAKSHLISLLESAPYDSPSYHLCHILAAASANHQSHPPLEAIVSENASLRELVTRFGSDERENYKTIVELFLDEKKQGVSRDFGVFVRELLADLQGCFDETMYLFLLNWNRRPTIPVTVAPPSEVPVAAFKIPPLPDFSEKNIWICENESLPYVYEGETHVIKAGSHSKIAYAMDHSVIEIEDSGSLTLFMAGHEVTVKLNSSASYLNIEKAGRNCHHLTILDENGHHLTKDAILNNTNISLGKGVIKKLH